MERGEVVPDARGPDGVGPLLLAEANGSQYAVERYRVPGVLPPSIAEVGYAERVSR